MNIDFSWSLQIQGVKGVPFVEKRLQNKKRHDAQKNGRVEG